MSFRICFLLLAFMVSISWASTEKRTYIIHMDKEKMAHLDTALLSTSKRWYEAVIDSITESLAQEGKQEQEASLPLLLYVYETTMFGFSAKLSKTQLQSLKRINGFLLATPDEMLMLHTTHSPEFLGLKFGQGLWSLPNMASDVIIGVLDTGVWPEHISFHDTGFLSPVPTRWKGMCDNGTRFGPSNCNKKLIGARAFFKAYEANVGRINETADYRSPRDAEGHGTHTASTAGGNLIIGANFLGMAQGMASGMKYTARLAVYKVCYTFGCSSADILAAIDQAVRDGVDVLSLSLGGGSRPYFADNIAIASFGAVQNGVFVSCSAGNSGPLSSTVSNAAPWIMTVAASYLDRSFPTAVRLVDGQIFKGASLYRGKGINRLPLVYDKTAGSQGAAYCLGGSLDSRLVKGKIVACQRGISSRVEKGEQVKMAGGAGMLLLNTQEQGEELFADAHILPATSLGALAGNAIKKYVSSVKNPMASIVFQGTLYGNPAPVMAAFSSRGPSAVGPDVIKPDITAPGVNILAAWPPEVSPTRLKSDKRRVFFNIVSGTSMSCPHVSGIAALLKSAHKDWSPAAIKSALMTTAYTVDTKQSPIADVSPGTSNLATPFAFGSGHVDPQRASDPGLIYDITPNEYLTYLCSIGYTSSQVTIVSRGGFTCPSDLVMQPEDLNYPSFAATFIKNAKNGTITYKRTVTNVGTARSTYAVDVIKPDGVSVIVEPKVLHFDEVGQRLGFKVTFLASGERTNSDNFSFGSLAWESGKYNVRSPIAITWQ